MKSIKINIKDLEVKSFITSLNDNKELKTNLLKGGSSEDVTRYTGHINGDCDHLIKP